MAFSGALEQSTSGHHSLGSGKGNLKVLSWSLSRQFVYWDTLRHVAVHDGSKSQAILETMCKICDIDILQGATERSVWKEV